MADNNDILVQVENLKIHFFTNEGTVRAVDGVTFDIHSGKTLCMVGESGCGKSVTARALLQIVHRPGKIVDGDIILHRRKSQDQTEKVHISDMEPKGRAIRSIRGKEISMIFQEPMTSLSPMYTVGNQIMETVILHTKVDKNQARERALEMLKFVGIPRPERIVDEYPFHLSGGMRQRAMIAMALSCNPGLLIADEPTTALDVTIQAQIVDLVKRLQEKIGMAVIWITHDLGVVAGMARRVNVMYAGSIIESGPVKEIYANPHHPYTVVLLGSLPGARRDRTKRLYSIKGEPPDLVGELKGCPFAPRCAFRVERCAFEAPVLEEIDSQHIAACWEKANVRRVQ